MVARSALCTSTLSTWKLHGDASDRGSFVPQKRSTTRVQLISVGRSPIFCLGTSLLRNKVWHLVANETQLFREPKSITNVTVGGRRCLRQLTSTQWPIVAGERWLSRGRRCETGGARWEGAHQRNLRQPDHTSLHSSQKRTAVGVVEINASMSFIAHAATEDMGFTAQAGEQEGGEEVGSYQLDERQRHADDSQKQVPYDWQAEWYPVWYSQEFPDGKPVPITIFDKPLVLYRDSAGIARCVEDKCPHRLAKLSEGQIAHKRNIAGSNNSAKHQATHPKPLNCTAP
ncbi:hypothetical protein CBR_g19419 [Chara braunii]|uniref:Rieske domain-containing protein n=1 Tax=Chara braunii TaxID=69332 RepID=A0A388KXW9_CHABU|nr:hypothetical protein CBR_g19419 [Chara braunii]|eukprot:GBG74906.1 hypothetical protein CBR_g19419 [Chara braunii]